MLNIISLGAGVQSSAMALMAAEGIITPMPDGAIFADTQSEPAAVYRQLEFLESRLPFPVYRVTAGSLREQILAAMTGEARMDGRPPFFTRGGGMLMRQCTQDFKIRPIRKQVRELIGLKYRQRGPKTPVVQQWIGISTDEADRMKPSRDTYIENRWPLIELDYSREDCQNWIRAHGYPMPPKSACTFCPYHNDAMWREMKERDPVSFADAVAVDEAIRPGVPGPKRPEGEAWFVHRKRVPLVQIEFARDPAPEVNHFRNECEGMCGN